MRGRPIGPQGGLDRRPGPASGALGALALRVVAARLERAVPALALDHRLAAERAGLVQHLRLLAGPHGAVLALVGPVLALRVPVARHERAVPALALDQLALVALGAGLAGRHRLGLLLVPLHVLALGIAGAADELAVPPAARLQRPPALGALLVQQLGLVRLAARQHRLAVPARRVPRAALERPEPAGLEHELALVALGTLLAGL